MSALFPATARQIFLSVAGIVADGVTDQAAKLQAIFNTNSAGGELLIINDLAGQVYTSGNTCNAQTTVWTLPGGSWKLATNSQKPLLMNANPVKSTPTALAAPTDHDIRILGGYWDGNSRGFSANGNSASATPYKNNAGFYISILAFYGVKNLKVEQVEVYDAPCYGIHYANVVNGRFYDIRGSIPNPAAGGGNDICHGNGPLNDIILRGIYGKTNDDVAPWNLVDNNYDNTGAIITPDAYGGFVGYGDGYDLMADGIVLDGSSQGMRVLVGLGVRGDRITIRNVTGSCRSFPIVFDRSQFYNTGSIGSVVVENINVQALTQDARLLGAGYPPCTIYVQAPIDSLTVSNLISNNPADARACLLLRETIGSNPAGSITALTLNGLTRLGSVSGQANANLIDIRAGASVGQFTASGINWASTLTNPGTLINVASGGTLGPYVISNSILPGNATVTAGAGTSSSSNNVANIVTLIAPSSLFSDNFTRANASSLGANYLVPAGNSANPSIVSNTCQFVSNVGNSIAQIAPAGSALSLGTTWTCAYTGGPGAGVILNSSAGFQGYILQYNTAGQISLVHQGSSNTTLYASASGAYSGTQNFQLMRSGSNFTLVIGGVQVWSGTDSSPINNSGVYLYAGTPSSATVTYASVTLTNP